MHDNLINYYQTNFILMKEHGMALTELEMMLPYEREIYLMLLNNYIEKKNAEIQAERNRQNV